MMRRDFLSVAGLVVALCASGPNRADDLAEVNCSPSSMRAGDAAASAMSAARLAQVLTVAAHSGAPAAIKLTVTRQVADGTRIISTLVGDGRFRRRNAKETDNGDEGLVSASEVVRLLEPLTHSAAWVAPTGGPDASGLVDVQLGGACLQTVLPEFVIAVDDQLQRALSDRAAESRRAERIAKALRDTSQPPAFRVTWSDLHGLWGGTSLVLDSSTRRLERMQAHPRSEVALADGVVLSDASTTAVAALLVEIEAWEQRVPDRDPRPDESRAYLRIEADGVRVEVWEWYNDMDKNRRLSRVRDHLRALFPSQDSPDSGKPSQ